MADSVADSVADSAVQQSPRRVSEFENTLIKPISNLNHSGLQLVEPFDYAYCLANRSTRTVSAVKSNATS